VGILIFLIVSYILLCYTLQSLFAKAGEDSKKAWIPGTNFAVWAKIIGKDPKKVWWLLFPIVNIFTFCGMAVDMVRSFNKLKLGDSALAVFYAPLAFFLIGRDEKATYAGAILTREKEYKEKIEAARKENNTYELKRLEANNLYKKSEAREWVESIFFAVFAAAFIRMFLIEAYVIPTSSMEGSLLVGDFLFVSKPHYGLRLPMTVLQIPLLHNRIPFIDRESYLKEPSLPYTRLPKISDVKLNDPVVFNLPEGDSIFVMKDRSYSIYQMRAYGMDKNYLANYPVTVRPIDKKDHYIKRCVGLPGDTLQIKDKQIFLNGTASPNPSGLQYSYMVKSSSPLNLNKMEEWGVSLNDHPGHAQGYYNLTNEEVDKIKTLGGDVSVQPLYKQNEMKGMLYPNDTTYYGSWTVDNYGPIFIPKKGTTVALSPQNLVLYKRVIGVLEGNQLEIKGDKAYINGVESSTYTFKQNYYWMMGDNRHNSEDSRFWGFVPEDHIVGKPLFIWFSTKNGSISNGIRWNRIFTSANKM